MEVGSSDLLPVLVTHRKLKGKYYVDQCKLYAATECHKHDDQNDGFRYWKNK